MQVYEAIKEIFEIENIEEKLKSSSISYNKLIEAIVDPAPGRLHTKLGVSAATANKWLKRLFPDKLSTSATYTTYLLFKYELKYCPACKEVLDISLFYKNKNKTNGLNSYCKDCLDEETSRTSSFRQSKYKAAKLQRTPKWLTEEDYKDILRIYLECPKGYHVDHILPLQGELVSGLHVPNNLQYLPSVENISKSNKFTPI